MEHGLEKKPEMLYRKAEGTTLRQKRSAVQDAEHQMMVWEMQRRVRESSCKAQEAIPQLCWAVAKLSLGHCIHFGALDFKERNELSEKALREKDRRSRKHDL